MTILLSTLYGQIAAGVQMYGEANTKAIYFNANTISENINVSSMNAFSAGPITISDGFSVNIATGGSWLII